MTFPRLLAFAEYWHETPPVNEVVVGLFAEKEDQGDPEEFLSMFPRA